MVIIPTLSEIIALECSGVRRRTKVELGPFFLSCTDCANYRSFVGILGGASTELVVDFLSVRNGEE